MLHLAQNIKLIRGLADKTQPEFAILISENLSNLKTYETKGIMPKLHIQHRIAKIAGVSVEDLINKKLTPDDISINLEVDKVKKVKKDAPVNHIEAQHGANSKDGVSKDVIEVKAKIDVLFDVAVELLSATSGESVTLIRKKLEKRVDELRRFSGE